MAFISKLSCIYLRVRDNGKMTSNMIWYACYGSNMDLDRFLKYIQGEQLTVKGEIKNYKGCPGDKSLPQNSEPYLIGRRFFFAKESKTWNKYGVGFISNKEIRKVKLSANCT